MPAEIAILIAQKLADERTRKIIIAIVAVLLSIIFLLVAGLQAIITLFTITLSTFLTEDTSLVGQTVALMDEARDAYVDEQMAEYRQRTDRNGNAYRNVILQWENGFSNNDKEVLTIVSCYYEQDWETDMSALACWVALKSVSFSTRERGPYSCGGCMSRKVCDGHPDGNGGTYHHSDDAADCDNYHTVTYCPGDHYDLYVTATLPGCQDWRGDTGATEQTIARWEELSDLSYTRDSAVMQQYQQAVRMATLNEDWEGWTELNIEWSKVLFQTDWEELYGVTVTQVGITDSGSYTPDDSFTGNLPGSGNGTFILPLPFWRSRWVDGCSSRRYGLCCRLRHPHLCRCGRRRCESRMAQQLGQLREDLPRHGRTGQQDLYAVRPCLFSGGYSRADGHAGADNRLCGQHRRQHRQPSALRGVCQQYPR